MPEPRPKGSSLNVPKAAALPEKREGLARGVDADRGGVGDERLFEVLRIVVLRDGEGRVVASGAV